MKMFRVNQSSLCSVQSLIIITGLAVGFSTWISAGSAIQGQVANQEKEFAKISLRGTLKQNPDNKGGMPYVLVDGIKWQLKLDGSKTPEEKWKEWLGETVSVAGGIEIQSAAMNAKSAKLDALQSQKILFFVKVTRIRKVRTGNWQLQARQDQARATVSAIGQACKMYHLNLGRPPSNLNDLMVKPANVTQRQWRGPYLAGKEIPKDPWGNEFRLEVGKQNRITIRSAGPDGKWGTDDDIE